MSKEAVSQSYMDQQKAIHAGKPLLDKRSAVVIGANPSHNIGASIARRISEDFVNVFTPKAHECDVRSPLSVSVYMGELPDDVDTLILSNGYTHLDWMEEASVKDVFETVNINLIGSFLAAQAFVRATINRPYRKQIVFIGSMAYKAVLNGSAIYCASKAGLAHLTKCLGWELAPKGFDVFCVHPSNTEGTPMTEETIRGLMRYRGLDREEAEKYWGAVLPKPEWLQPHDIAEVVSFLVSGKAGYLSGSNLDLAGGQR